MRVNYPGQLEHFWREEARRLWGFLSEEELVERIRPSVQTLSDRFTTERHRATEVYGDDAETQLAYGLFFFPQTFMRTQFVLEECWRPAGAGEVRILDLGAGSGAAGFAALIRLGDRPASLRAVDGSSVALQSLARAADACRELWPNANVETAHASVSAVPDSAEKYGLILCSFALNELAERDSAFDAAAWTQALMNRLEPGGLLVLLEPALKTTSERLEALRDRAAAEGWARIVGPCMHHARCPMLASGRYWCHEVRRWEPPPLAEKINRKLFRDLPHLKFSFLALTPGRGVDVDPSPLRARMVAPMMKERGKFTTRGCAADGALHDYELLMRGFSSDEKREVAQTERGTRVEWEALVPLGNGALRASGMKTQR